jgi:transcription elongation factor Elf1
MISVKPIEDRFSTCQSCERVAVVRFLIQVKNWTYTVTLCKKCQTKAWKELSPMPISKADLQRVWDMAQEMSGENSYGVWDDDEAGAVRVGTQPIIVRALNRVKKAFGLRGKDVK